IIGDRAFGEPVLGEPGGRPLFGDPALARPAAGLDPCLPGGPEAGLVGAGLSAADDLPEHGRNAWSHGQMNRGPRPGLSRLRAGFAKGRRESGIPAMVGWCRLSRPGRREMLVNTVLGSIAHTRAWSEGGRLIAAGLLCPVLEEEEFVVGIEPTELLRGFF